MFLLFDIYWPLQIWSDILSMISQGGYLPDLLENLTSTKFEDSFSKSVSEAWVSRILAQVKVGEVDSLTQHQFNRKTGK